MSYRAVKIEIPAFQFQFDRQGTRQVNGNIIPSLNYGMYNVRFWECGIRTPKLGQRGLEIT